MGTCKPGHTHGFESACPTSCPGHDPRSHMDHQAEDRGEFGMPGVGSGHHVLTIAELAQRAHDEAFVLTGTARQPSSTEKAIGWRWEGQPYFLGWMRRSCCKAPDIMGHHYADCPFFKADEVYAKGMRSITNDGEGTQLKWKTDVPITTEVGGRVVRHWVPNMVEHFLRRNKEYGEDDEFNLGLRGEYVGLSRKLQKLKRYIWEEQQVPDGAESVRTILLELSASCLLAADMEEQERVEVNQDANPLG